MTSSRPAQDSCRSVDRSHLIDALKLLAMGMVVLTHVLGLRHEFKSLSPQTVDVMVAFNMPLFTFLSGFVTFGREGARPLRFLRGKALGLLIPYLAWIAVELPLRHYPPSAWLPRLAGALVDPHLGLQMWFLWLLFWLFTLFTVVRAISRNEWWLGAGAVAVGATLFVGSTTVFGLDKIAWLYPFFIFGYLVAKHRTALARYATAAAIVSAISFPLLVLVGGEGVGLRFLTALAGVGFAWAGLRMLPLRALALIGFVGQKTLGLYGWQMVVLPYLIVGSGWPGALGSWALVMSVATLLTVVLERFWATRAVFLGQWPRAWR